MSDSQRFAAAGDLHRPPPLPASLVHRIRGRDRLSCEALWRDPELAGALRADLLREPAIRRVRVSPAAASVVIEYADPDAQAQVAELLAGLPGQALALVEPAAAAPGGGEPRRSRQRGPTTPAPAKAADTAGEGSDWHVLELAAVLQALKTDLEGLDPAEARRRLERDGPNILRRMQRRSDWRILLEQFQSAPVAMLGISAVIAAATAAPLDAGIIAVVVGANAAIGFLTERQAENTIASLAEDASEPVTVLRAGRMEEIDAAELVRGDMILLEPGMRLPADARVVKAHNLSVDESSLTGESLPVHKAAGDSPERRVLADRHSMVHLGTVVSGGDGRAVVTETGDATELGRIQALAAGSAPPMTPMQRELARVSTQLAVLSSAVCGLVFVVGLLRGQPRLRMLNTAISLAVAAVPEGLPAISNSLLAIGIRRMREKNVLARHLDAIENLGAVDVLCVDKTGTLTENRMRVARTCGWRDLAPDERFWKVLALCNEAQAGGEGSSTELALLEAAAEHGVSVDRLRRSQPRVKVRYRSDRRPYMVTVHRYPRKQGFFVAVKGRPKQVLAKCTHLRQGRRRVPLTDAHRAEILHRNGELMDQSYRVLGVAWKHAEEARADGVDGLEWLGLAALSDPLRPEVTALIPRLQAAGIRVIVLTGDQRGTAAAVGRSLGLNGSDPVVVVGADELEALPVEAWGAHVREAHVFARVSPAMKLQLVRQLQEAGHVVAMTGDGINDGPALKVADVGIAMGASGSSVARDMADLVLADDRLQSIVDAIAYGRGSFANLEKAIEYLLATNFSEIEVTLGSLALGLPTPLTAVQLLWINLVTDVFPALAIGFEEPESDVLRLPPAAGQGVLNGSRLREMFGHSLVISAGAMSAYLYALARYGPGRRASSHAFMTLTTAQLLQALSSRSRSSSLFRPRGNGPNPWLKTALAGSLALQGVALVPGLRGLFGVSRLSLLDAGVIAVGAVGPYLVNEARKALAEPAGAAEDAEDGDG